MGTGRARYLLRDIEVRGAFLQRVGLLRWDDRLIFVLACSGTKSRRQFVRGTFARVRSERPDPTKEAWVAANKLQRLQALGRLVSA
jgi:hypothetical protein